MQFQDEHQFLVHLSHLLMETLLLLPLVVFLYVRSQNVAVLPEEIVHAGIVRHVQPFLQLSPLNLDDRFVEPVVMEEDKAREHLFRCIVLIGTLAIELLGEIDGIGLYGAHPVVIDHEELSELLGSLLGKDTRGGVKR